MYAVRDKNSSLWLFFKEPVRGRCLWIRQKGDYQRPIKIIQNEDEILKLVDSQKHFDINNFSDEVKSNVQSLTWDDEPLKL